MSTSPSARKRLPVKPSQENLKKQAKRRAKLDAIQLAESQHRLAGEYGCRNWAELMHVVETMLRGSDQVAYVKYEMEALPKAANRSDIETVRAILASGEFTQHDLDLALARSVLAFDTRADIARLLVEHGADPDGQYGSDYGPIVFVTGECLDPDGLQFLIDHGADVTAGPIDTKYGKVCIMSHTLGTYARGSNERKHRMIDILLKHGAFVPPEVTPLFMTIHRGDAKGLADLIDTDRSLLKRRFVDMPYGNIALGGATLLHCAVEFGEIECIDELFKRYADINMKADVIDGVGGQTPIYHAINTVRDWNFPVLEHLADKVGKNIDMTVKATWRRFGEVQAAPLTPLEYAEKAEREIDPKQAGNRPRVKDELELLRSLDRRGQLKNAIRGNDVAAVTHALDEHPELLTPELWPPAIFETKSLEITKLLLDRGLNPDLCSAPRKPLHLAVYQCLADIVELLIECGADVNQLNPLGERPLDLLDAYEPRPVGDPDARRIRAALLKAGAVDDIHSAVRAGDVEAVGRLLDADPANLETKEPWPPLFSAARSGRVEVAKLLIARGANVNAPNSKANTPLWFACQSPAQAEDRRAVAKLLIDSGARVRDGCEDGSTALHFAAWRGPVAMVELLISRGAKEWQQDDHGKKPIEYARDGVAADKDQIVALLDRPVIRDPAFKAAVAAIQAGDLSSLRRLLVAHPNLVHDRAIEPDCYPPSYFSNPKLLWFVADNPNLIEKMPVNTIDITAAIIDAGAEKEDLDYTLGLVMTSRPAREQHLQRPLINLLVSRGATVTTDAILSTLGHGEIDAVHALLDAGLPLTTPIAAGIGWGAKLKSLLTEATDTEIHAALSMAVINRQLDAARLCIQAGADMNRFMVVHAHSLPIHQAAVNDDAPMLRLLVESGAKLDIRDTLWNGTPLGWAIHGKMAAAEAYLRSIGAT
jgi:ankyrin repeat protein